MADAGPAHELAEGAVCETPSLGRRIIQCYLIGYNAAQTCGWTLVLGRLAWYVSLGSTGRAWDAIGPSLLFWQNVAALEVIHALFGVVRAPWFTTGLQISSRLVVVNLVGMEPALHAIWPLLLLALVWGATEVIRYSWYAANLMGVALTAHTWLRYSTFWPLYPAGVLGELLVLYAALATPLARAAPVGVPAGLLLRGMMFVYVPCFPALFLRLVRQRAKALSAAGHAAAKAE